MDSIPHLSPGEPFIGNSSKRKSSEFGEAVSRVMAQLEPGNDEAFDSDIDVDGITLEMSVSMSRHSCSIEPDDFIDEYAGAVKAYRDDLGDDVEVGKFTAYRCNRMSAHEHDVCDFDLFDAHVPGYEYLGALSKIENDESSLDVLIIHSLEIFSEYRGKDIGLMAMQVMIERLAIPDCSMVLIMPSPLQSDGYPKFADPRMKPMSFKSKTREQAKRKLRKHYARLGFKLIPRTELMAINLNEGGFRSDLFRADD